MAFVPSIPSWAKAVAWVMLPAKAVDLIDARTAEETEIKITDNKVIEIKASKRSDPLLLLIYDLQFAVLS